MTKEISHHPGRRGWVIAAVGLAALGAALAAACGGGVSQSEYDAVQTQVAQEQQKAASVQQQLSAKVQEAAQAQQQATAKDADLVKVKDQVAAKDKEIADLNKAAGASAGVTTLIGAKQLPTPTPRPTATPLPAGVPTPTPPPAVRVPAEIANEVIPFAFYVETLATTTQGIDGWGSTVACTPSSVFKRGTRLVWRFEVIDTSTGKRVTDLDAPTIKVRLPHGEELTARFSRRGGVGPWTWSSNYTIPLDYPLGAFDYQILVTTKEGRTGTFDQDKVALVRAATDTAAGIDSRVKIVN